MDTPQPVPSLAGLYHGNEKRAGAISALMHASAVALLLFVGSLKPVQMLIPNVTPLFAPVPVKPLKLVKAGGGGGARQPVVSKGSLPRSAPRQFTPPQPVQETRSVVLPLIGADLPSVASANVGMPTGLAGLSYGPGLDGIGGPGKGGTGPGPGRGSGDNDGDGGLGALKIGSGVSAPQPIFTPEPEYSEEARKAKLGGIVLLSLVVDASGRPVDIHVIRSLGLGLDEKAIEAVKRWVFAPGKKDGKPVAVRASAEVSFRLL